LFLSSAVMAPVDLASLGPMPLLQVICPTFLSAAQTKNLTDLHFSAPPNLERLRQQAQPDVPPAWRTGTRRCQVWLSHAHDRPSPARWTFHPRDCPQCSGGLLWSRCGRTGRWHSRRKSMTGRPTDPLHGRKLTAWPRTAQTCSRCQPRYERQPPTVKTRWRPTNAVAELNRLRTAESASEDFVRVADAPRSTIVG